MNELIIFDFDGTLSDSKTSIVLTFQQACVELGYPAPTSEIIAPLIGLPLVDMFPRSLPPVNGRSALSVEQIDALVQAYRGAYIPIDREHTRLFGGVEDMLSSLGNYKLAIATSKTQSGANASLTRSGLFPHFDLIVGHDTVARPKPNPDMIEHVLRELGVAPDKAVMVGDTHFDLEMADAAGVRAVGVSWGMHGAEGLARWDVVHTMAALQDTLLRL
ncbi:MAG: phosphoglycolate phosphatase [Cognaticolwellia sp.]